MHLTVHASARATQRGVPTEIIETIFVWPGVGTLLTNAVKVRDLPVIQGVVVLIAVAVVILNLVVDLLVMVIDPRIRVGRR